MCEDFAEIDLANVESTFRSNILQMFAVTKYALPHLQKGASYVPSSPFAFPSCFQRTNPPRFVSVSLKPQLM